jgi:hypothetical protein
MGRVNAYSTLFELKFAVAGPKPTSFRGARVCQFGLDHLHSSTAGWNREPSV